MEKIVGKQFGSKIKELFLLIEKTPNWDKYVSEQTTKVIKTLYATKNMNDTLEKLDMKYTTVRAHLIRAIDRIKEQRKNYLRDGQSELAQRLFVLMDNPEWSKSLTTYEKTLAEKFKEKRNFYEVGRELNITPGNIAATLYGNTQKLGVIGKIQKQLS
jgi:predicted transcriptional regulator